MRRILAMAALLGGTTLGCGPGMGSVQVTIWGEDYIASGIPAMSAMAPGGITNGWSITYNKFLIAIGNFTVSSTTGMQGSQLAGMRVFDLHLTAQPAVVGSIPMLAAQRWDRVSYEIGPANAQTTAGNVPPADLALMQTNGWSVYMDATATHPTMGQYTFRWGFANNVLFETCHNRDNQAGIVVPTGGSFQAQITVHGDHPFYDDLQSPDAVPRFDAVAGADANMDRMITLEELEAVRLTSLPAMQYGTGPVPNVVNLRQFVSYLIATVGHFDGEGHCEERRR